jgi:hypothetical protein
MGTIGPDEGPSNAEPLDLAAPLLIEKLEAVDGLVVLHVDAADNETEAIAATPQSTDFGVALATALISKRALGGQVAGLLVDARRQLAKPDRRCAADRFFRRIHPARRRTRGHRSRRQLHHPRRPALVSQ